MKKEIEIVRWIIRTKQKKNSIGCNLIGFDKEGNEYEMNYRDHYDEFRALDIFSIDAPEKDKEKIKKKLSNLN